MASTMRSTPFTTLRYPHGLPGTRSWRRYSYTGDVALLHSCDIDLMPPPDGPYERAEVNRKTKIYLASSLLVVFTPVGMNNVFLSQGERGAPRETSDDWVEANRAFADSASLRERTCHTGRRFMERQCGIPAIGSSPLASFSSVINRPGASPRVDAVAC